MRPYDPRLLVRVPDLRRPFAALSLTGVVTAVLVVVQATALASAVAAAAASRLDATALLVFAAAVAGRAVVGWIRTHVAAAAAATAKARLRDDLVGAVVGRGPTWLAGHHTGELATLAGRGLDALDDYIVGYLPQMVLAATIPVAALARLITADWGAAIIVMITLPLIPIFGALLGWQARLATERQWRRLATLGGHFLDMVAGLPTLRAFGRAQAQVRVVRRMADAHREATMATLRIAFLSGAVLEFIATLSVALVAVPVGLRLLGGGMNLATALLVLFLVPEVYMPLRAAGAKFHSSMEGLTVLDRTFALLDENENADESMEHGADSVQGEPGPEASRRPGAGWPGGRPRGEIRFDHVTVEYDRAGERVVALRDASFVIEAGQRVAIVGPSGAGKSTVLAVLLGFVRPATGRVSIDGVDISDVDIDEWRRHLAWVPQRPHLFTATLADNIRLGQPQAGDEAVTAAVAAAELASVVDELPDGLTTLVGERGRGLSSGQQQRVALARAFLRDAPVLMLDEPTARLDSESEAAVVAASRRLAAGRTAVLVAHRPALLRGADRVLRLVDGVVTEIEPMVATTDETTNEDRR